MISDKEVRSYIHPHRGTIREICQSYNTDLIETNEPNCRYVRAEGIIYWNGKRTESLCHELAHHLQYKTGWGYRNTFEEQVVFERQAERIAYYLHKEHFHYIHHSKFSAYRKKWHLDFLWQWWYGDPSSYLEGENEY